MADYTPSSVVNPILIVRLAALYFEKLPPS